MKRLMFLSIIILILICAALPIGAGELYIWTDENGVKQITSTPPPAKIKSKVERQGYERNDPAEIEEWKRKQEAISDQIRAKEQSEQRIREINQQINEANSRNKENKAKYKEAQKKAEEFRQQDIDHLIKQAESRAESARREKNNARDDYWRASWQRRQDEAEFEVRRLRDLQK